MGAKLYADGDVIDYQNGGTALAVGDIIVIGTNNPVTVGVALTAIAANAIGAVAIRGSFVMPKLSGAVIKAGETVDWDVSGLVVDDNLMVPATGDCQDFGVALEDAGNGTTTVKVSLLPGRGSKT